MSIGNPYKRKGILRRLLGGEKSKAQVYFDLIVGIIAPILCLYFDPILFKDNSGSSTVLSEIRIFAYSGIVIGATSLAVCLFQEKMSLAMRGFLIGVLIFGMIFALALEFILLPLGILGIMVGVSNGLPENLPIIAVSLLGFLPFLVAFIYIRNAYQLVVEPNASSSAIPSYSIMAGLIFVIAVPMLLQVSANNYVDSSIQKIVAGDITGVSAGVESMKHTFWCDDSCYQKLFDAYWETEDEQRKEFIAEAYRESTGRNLIGSRINDSE